MCVMCALVCAAQSSLPLAVLCHLVLLLLLISGIYLYIYVLSSVCLYGVCMYILLIYVLCTTSCEFAEPKSGTGTSGEWAWGGLVGACIYLRSLYGEASCRVNQVRGYHKEIVFEPRWTTAEEAAPCSCDDVTRYVDCVCMCVGPV